MTIICIESSTSVCSAAVCKDGVPSKQCICREGSNHARLLPRYIDELLAFVREQGWSIDAVALSEGPGSYTGLRIGAATAKGLCYGLNVPLIPVPTLEILCQAAKERIRGLEDERILIPMIDARRMEVYTTIMVNGERMNGERARAVVVENEDSLMSERLTNERDVYYFGDGAAKCQNVLTKPNWHYIADIVPEAKYVGEIVESRETRVESGESRDESGETRVERLTGNELAYYEPYYLKEFVAAPSHVKGLN